ALLALEHDASAWLYSPRRGASELLATLHKEVESLHPETATVLSLAAQSTETEVVIRSSPRPSPGPATRPPAVAGRFYPADTAARGGRAGGLWGASPGQPEPGAAAMVPHAGLTFSGQLAASVLNRLKSPRLVLVLGPKHTRQGVRLAVAPHETWAIPGATIASDAEIARALAAAIPGLQLDAAAHQNEHAIEVELPLLARLAPGCRVVGLAIGGGDWEHC